MKTLALIVLCVLLVGCCPLPKQRYTIREECIDFTTFKQLNQKICSAREPLRRSSWFWEGEYEKWYTETECVKKYDTSCRKERGEYYLGTGKKEPPFTLPRWYEIKSDK
jgi:hypothetical protein